MRPVDDGPAGRSRSTSFTDSTITPQPPQMTFFLADENSMEASLSRSSSNAKRPREFSKRSNYGVESLETTISSLTQDNDGQETNVSRARDNWKKNLAKDMTKNEEEIVVQSRSSSPVSSVMASREMSPSEPQNMRSQHTNVSSQTPLSLQSPGLGSIASNPSSRRNSETDFFTDEVGSQAIMSSGEDDREAPSEALDNSASQLVMPSIKMPSRRPFTERGKNMGRLKVMIAGDSGIGKTSLIKAMVQVCEDIVHVDTLSSTPLSTSETIRMSKLKRRSTSDMNSTKQIKEVYASTRAYPHWWSDLEDGKLIRRRKSTGDSVLERNLCFVDTPGYGNGTSCIECITTVVQYVESQLEKSLSAEGVKDADLINLLDGNGGSQVDVVLYVILHRLKTVDLEYMSRLSPLTNIIPLVAQSESLTPEQVRSMKANILSQLREANIKPFLFGVSPEKVLSSSEPLPPFAVSSVATTDTENMDASILMSPDYVAPLIDSDLGSLVALLFSPDTISWLRHSAAKKAVQFLKSCPPPHPLPRSLSLPTASVLRPAIGAATSYQVARLTDHTQREEQLAQIRLSKWATDLQRSLQNERARFEALAGGERAVWLTERLGECVMDGTLVPIRTSSPSRNSGGIRTGSYSRRRNHSNISGLDRQDPLGLLQLNAEMRRKSWKAVQIVGGFGVIGGLALWIAGRWNDNAYIWGWNLLGWNLLTDW